MEEGVFSLVHHTDTALTQLLHNPENRSEALLGKA